MTRTEREQIICRYLGGEMTSAEEHDFFIQVAVDKELRHELKAHRTVDSAMRKDRDAEAAGHTALRMRVAAMLPSAIPDTSIPQTGSTAPAPAGAGISPATTTAGAVSMKWLAAVVGGALLTAGAVLTVQLASPTISGEREVGKVDSRAGVRQLDTIHGDRPSATAPGGVSIAPGVRPDSSAEAAATRDDSKANPPVAKLTAQTARRGTAPSRSSLDQASARNSGGAARGASATPVERRRDSSAGTRSESGDSIPVSVKIKFGDK